MAVRNGKNFAIGLNFGFSATSDFLSHASQPSKGAPDQRMRFLSFLLGLGTYFSKYEADRFVFMLTKLLEISLCVEEFLSNVYFCPKLGPLNHLKWPLLIKTKAFPGPAQRQLT